MVSPVCVRKRQRVLAGVRLRRCASAWPCPWSPPTAWSRLAEVAAAGATEVITVPWYFFGGDLNDPPVQDESIARFAAEVIRPLASA